MLTSLTAASLGISTPYGRSLEDIYGVLFTLIPFKRERREMMIDSDLYDFVMLSRTPCSFL